MTEKAFLDAVAAIDAVDGRQSLLTFRRGIEREALRVSQSGGLAQTPHPTSLGSKLTHPKITTDFSEAQLELITPPATSAEAALRDLDATFRFVYSALTDEILWSSSMPCVLQDDTAIPLAYYGESNLGRLKTTYRNGLGHRYGRGMQTICAVHYNFSLTDDFWQWLHDREGSSETLKDFRTRRYFDLMRNFRRYSWLLTYLFGASPAVCNSFVKGKQHNLQAFDEGTAYLPYATSLRSGNLGYQSDTQASRLKVCYNGIDSYVSSLADAICTAHDEYQQIGTKKDDEYLQVNDNILQSEAEFYSSIRAKCVPAPGENFLATLLADGVQYVEVRLLDVNPFLPLGINESEIHFLDTFLLYCLVSDSPMHDDDLCDEVGTNALSTVYQGRDPALHLTDNGNPVSLREWAGDLLSAMKPFANLLDSTHYTSQIERHYATSVQKQMQRVIDPDLTPSGQILTAMQDQGVPFFRFAMNQALKHEAYFRERPPTAEESKNWAVLAEASLADQAAIESADSQPFDDYLAAISEQYLPLRSN